MTLLTMLIFHEDPDVVKSLSGLIEREMECHVQAVSDISAAIEKMGNETIDVIISDFSSSNGDASAILGYLLENNLETRYIAYSDKSSVRDSVTAMKQGAFDYISDEDNPDDIIAALKQAVEVSDKDKTRQNSRLNVSNIVGESSGIKQVFKTVGRVSVTDTTVLITGESGTGKELIARAIHASSGRHNKPMIVINCGAIPGELLESELFGHEKGAFTGAHRTRIGRFELADGGTIFLDEIGDMSSDLQVKLLRVLQEQNFERVGGTRSLNVDVRILAATNKNLRNAIKEGSFREDLYYRLNVIPIHVPPLRERRSDIPLLVDFFQKRLSDRIGEPQKSFSDESINKLVRYEWPGNIRELENLMERVAVLVEESVVEVSDLPERIRGGVISGQPSATISFEDGQSFSDLIEQFQKNLIIQALNQTNWVKAKASTLLKMNRTTLVEKIKKLNIEAPSSEEEHLEDILFR